jgi:hypothetical protein
VLWCQLYQIASKDDGAHKKQRGTAKMDIKEIELFWISEAEEALQVADHLMEKGDYSYALFLVIWQLKSC